MTLNGKMALILRYYAEFGSLRGTLRKSASQSHNYGQFTITMSSKKRLQNDRATRINILLLQGANSVADSCIQDLMRSTCLTIV